jgi:DNA-binding LacI/PurR family transcriptional regulator
MSTPQNRPTIDDVAARAGVSIGTVSRVLNGLDRVSPATRRRILQAIEDLQYEPNNQARSLALRRTKTIGLVIPSITDSFFSGFVRGVEETATAASYSMLVRSQPWSDQGAAYEQLFTPTQVDGLVLAAINVTRQLLDQLTARGVRVAVCQEDLGGYVPTFLVDNYGGARELVEHLVGHGYRRIAYIAGSDRTPDSKERLRALRDVLQEHGLALPEAYVIPGDFGTGTGYVAMQALLNLNEPPEAVFAGNDQMAADAIRAVRERGLQVPGDVAIVGFDDIALASYITPTLSTVRQPTYRMGQLAVEAILEPQYRRGDSARVVLPTELVVRESCGCPARSPLPGMKQ